MRSPTRPAANEIGMRCKPLFYFSRWPLVFGRRLLVVGNTIPCHPERRIIVRSRTMIRSRGTLRFLCYRMYLSSQTHASGQQFA